MNPTGDQDQSIADFWRGLKRFSDERLRFADRYRIDPETVPEWHRLAYLLQQATPEQIERQYLAASASGRHAMAQRGRSDRENADAVNMAIVDMLAKAQERSPTPVEIERASSHALAAASARKRQKYLGRVTNVLRHVAEKPRELHALAQAIERDQSHYEAGAA